MFFMSDEQFIQEREGIISTSNLGSPSEIYLDSQK